MASDPKKDSDDSDENEEPSLTSPTSGGVQELTSPTKKQGFGLRAKKFFASASADSVMGRKIIAMFLGEEGNHMLKTIKHAAEKHYSNSKAKEIKANILKLAIKAHLLQQERLITKRDVWMLSDPINNLAIATFTALRPRQNKLLNKTLSHEDLDEAQEADKPKAKDKDKDNSKRPNNNLNPSQSASPKYPNNHSSNTNITSNNNNNNDNTMNNNTNTNNAMTIDPSPLVTEFNKVGELCVNLVKPHLTEKNVNKMKECFQLLGSHAFLNSLLNDPKFSEEKFICYTAIREIVAPLLANRRYDETGDGISLQQLCSIKGCQNYAAESNGSDGFKGSSFCLIHHEESLSSLLSHPSIDHFLTGEGRDYFPFQADLKKDVARYIRKLWLITTGYKNIPSGAKSIFIEEVLKKYVRKSASHKVAIDEQIILTIEERKKEKPPPTDLFDPLIKDLYSRMRVYFDTTWTKSSEWRSYIQSYQLPPYLQKELARFKKKKKPHNTSESTLSNSNI